MAYDPENILAKILRGVLPCDKVYADDPGPGFKPLNPPPPVPQRGRPPRPAKSPS